MIDDFGFRVRDLAAAWQFCDAAMAALGPSPIDNTATSSLVGRSAGQPIPFLWVVGTDPPAFWTSGHAVGKPIHAAFAAVDRAVVDRFHLAALAAGERTAVRPRRAARRRPAIPPAFVPNPDGNNVEAGPRSPR